MNGLALHQKSFGLGKNSLLQLTDDMAIEQASLRAGSKINEVGSNVPTPAHQNNKSGSNRSSLYGGFDTRTDEGLNLIIYEVLSNPDIKKYLVNEITLDLLDVKGLKSFTQRHSLAVPKLDAKEFKFPDKE